MLRVAHFDELDMINTDGIALTVYFCGCSFHCKGCQNPELQDFSGGTQYEFKELEEEIVAKYNKGEYDYICYLGGEPLQQEEDYIRVLTEHLVDRGIKIWMYTGYDYEEVPQWAKRLCYCIKCGLYDTRFPKVGKLATGNQAYYFRSGEIVR